MTMIRLLLATLFSTLFLAACATAPAPDPAPEPEVKEIPIEPWEGDGMDIPLDGSSREAFNASLARVKAHVTEAEYEGLLGAIDYLLIYDIPAKQDMDKLVPRLDGLTPKQIYNKVKWVPQVQD
jgi:hypothetical protein